MVVEHGLGAVEQEAWSCVIQDCFNIAQSNCHILGTRSSPQSQQGNGSRRIRLPIANCCSVPVALAPAMEAWFSIFSKLYASLNIPSPPASSLQPLVSNCYSLDTTGSNSLLSESFWKHVMFGRHNVIRKSYSTINALWLQKWN
ncbi:hypothetical protein V8C42DRAFT_334335 [Trichoderma barbatum]